MSSTGALCVSAPTATKSTPVRAVRSASSSVRPPLASDSTPRSRQARAATASSAGDMLSSSTRSAPAARASCTCATVSHSTSTGSWGQVSRTAQKACATPPAAATWLSLTRAASDSDMRWLTPPPHRTAYFSSARSPGVVLRVSRTRVPVPARARASAQRRVSVATPDRWQSRLSIVRSAVSRPRTRPVTASTLSPGCTRAPSLPMRSTAKSPSVATSSTARATGSPASTPACRGRASAVPSRSKGTVATLVTSTPPSRSSSSAARASAKTETGSRPTPSRRSATSSRTRQT